VTFSSFPHLNAASEMEAGPLAWGPPLAVLTHLKSSRGLAYAQFGESEEEINLPLVAAAARLDALGVRLVREVRMANREAVVLFDHEKPIVGHPLCSVTRVRVYLAKGGCMLPVPPAALSHNEVCACRTCGARDPPPRVCAACGQVAYCDVACQRRDWKAHKRRCAELKAAAAAAASSQA